VQARRIGPYLCALAWIPDLGPGAQS
jgi:hypothetical protein